jgi:hypothetical protein
MSDRDMFIDAACKAIKRAFDGVKYYTIGPFNDGAVVIGIKTDGEMVHVTATQEELSSMAHDISGLAARKASTARASYDRAYA